MSAPTHNAKTLIASRFASRLEANWLRSTGNSIGGNLAGLLMLQVYTHSTPTACPHLHRGGHVTGL